MVFSSPVFHKGDAVCCKCQCDQALLCVCGSVDKTEGLVLVYLLDIRRSSIMEWTKEVTVESGEVRGLPPSILVHLCTPQCSKGAWLVQYATATDDVMCMCTVP